jgi:hypothetical protein
VTREFLHGANVIAMFQLHRLVQHRVRHMMPPSFTALCSTASDT